MRPSYQHYNDYCYQLLDYHYMKIMITPLLPCFCSFTMLVFLYHGSVPLPCFCDHSHQNQYCDRYSNHCQPSTRDEMTVATRIDNVISNWPLLAIAIVLTSMNPKETIFSAIMNHITYNHQY